ncbi:hypothetical protein TNCV_4835991 [Trichonephila clavipes]|nr:hypothetical protein TNCV_4835991 [Trichonephila clavipes]
MQHSKKAKYGRKTQTDPTFPSQADNRKEREREISVSLSGQDQGQQDTDDRHAERTWFEPFSGSPHPGDFHHRIEILWASKQITA